MELGGVSTDAGRSECPFWKAHLHSIGVKAWLIKGNWVNQSLEDNRRKPTGTTICQLRYQGAPSTESC